MSKDWIFNTNVYEVNLRQYTQEGTINSFATHLPRLKDMGIETLWFMPITPIAQKNKKGTLGSYYACSDYTSVSFEFGTMEDWKHLVNIAHNMGFKVILDWVANHTGWDHKWTVEHPDWYKKDEATGDFKKASGMDDIIELDFNNPALRSAMINAMKFWMEEPGIDGFRCDLAFWVELNFWKEAKTELEKIKPLFWLGELDVLDNPEYMQVFDACYTWKWMHKAEEFYKPVRQGHPGGQQLPVYELINVLHQYQNATGVKAWFTSNHDENSWNGTEYEKYGDMAKALAVFSCTWQGIPLIYSGQELPNQKRLQFFEKDPIEWRPNIELHDFYKTLLQLKKNNSALNTNAEVKILSTNAGNKIFAYERKQDGNNIVVVLNLSNQQVAARINDTSGNLKNIFSNETVQIENDLPLQPWEYKVLLTIYNKKAGH